MDFSKLFQSKNTNHTSPQVPPSTEISPLHILPISSPSLSLKNPSWLRSIEMDREEVGLDYLHKIPLSERMRRLMEGDLYKSAYQDMLDAKLEEIIHKKIEKLKKENPEMAERISSKKAYIHEDALLVLKDQLGDLFEQAIFKEEEIQAAQKRLLEPSETLSRTDISVLKICLFIRKHNLTYIADHYGVRSGAFQAMIAKSMELANVIGEALAKDPRAIMGYGIECCHPLTGFNRGEVALAADYWVSRWLNPKMLKALIQEQKLMPKEGEKTKEPTRQDILKTHRYQNAFKTALLYYFFSSPTQAQKVFRMVLPHIAQTDTGIQERLWGILFQKYTVDPNLRGEVIQFISPFLEQGTNPKTQEILYSQFIKIVPPDKRANLLGHMPFKILKRYWITFQKHHPNIPYIALQTEEGKTHLGWRLFHENELDIEYMKKLLDKANRKTQRDFLFSPKKGMDQDLFLHLCNKFADSPFYFWQWVRSFRTSHSFESSLAKIYPTLPESVKENKRYISAMDRHFNLVQECAIAGDTGSLSSLKKTLGADIFWASLTQGRKDKISGICSLCRQGKRGLLKLIADLPIARQQALFMTTTSDGQTLLSECSGSLARLVAQDIFKQAYKKESHSEVPKQPKQAEIIPTEVPQPAKKKIYQRQIIRIPTFEGHMAKIANNPRLVQEVEETITNLSKMSKAEIATELREGWKNHGSLEKAPCAVKDIRGKNYRLGYLLKGDIDQGTGQIAILFFLTHAQYNIFLNKQADQAVKMANSMMNTAKPTSLGPTGPWGGNDGR